MTQVSKRNDLRFTFSQIYSGTTPYCRLILEREKEPRRETNRVDVSITTETVEDFKVETPTNIKTLQVVFIIQT